MKFILGEKIDMSQLFDKQGNAVPVTLVRVTPNVVTQVKTQEKDGYVSVQVGFGERKSKNIRKPQIGHMKELGNFQHLREFRLAEAGALNRGDKIDASVFAEGDTVKVSGISKSKGFQGVVKRHGFRGAPATHGTKHAHREPGAIGGAGGRAGGRVVKGMRMAGRMGGNRNTVSNLKIVKVDAENNVIAVLGAVPGRRGVLLEIRG
ncbi:MAG: 50S ribosomal protein L3 [Candidatus Sungbacteria bacterium]|nr:50S ribosomal protein L3 [Candidatus Sungbacteria bacterium]